MDRRLFIAGMAIAALAPTNASAHEFVAYFDYGGTILEANGYRMVRSAASYANGATGIRVTAHLDTMEDHEFSDELARCRSQVVATELVLLGVKPELIEITSKGAEALARPTPDNTAERLNRRVLVDVWRPVGNT